MTIEAGHTYHALYVAVHRAHKEAPQVWTNRNCNRVLTAIMAAAPFPWRVVGITKAALIKFSEFNFRKERKMGVTRAHLKQRSETARILFEPSEPFNESEFLNIWMQNDRTVLCAPGENKTLVPNVIPFENADGELFSSTWVDWRHARREQEFLKNLFERQPVGRISEVVARPTFTQASVTRATTSRDNGDLLRAADKYNELADPEFKAVGSAQTYRQIRPPRWPAGLHYEFYLTQPYLGAEVHIESDQAQPIAGISAPLDGQILKSVSKQLIWDPLWNSGRGRLTARFSRSEDLSMVPQAMKELIELTYSTITQKV